MPFGGLLGGLASAVAGPLVGRIIGGRGGRGSGSSENPAQAAMPYLERVGPDTRAMMQPYMDLGNLGVNEENANLHNLAYQYENAQNPYESMPNPYAEGNPMGPAAFEQMGNNPQEFVDRIMRGYTPSAGYNAREQRMMTAANNTAAQGGYQGNRQDQQARAQMVRDLMGEDMQQYLNNILGTQKFGLEGQERGMERRLLGNERFNERFYGGRERSLDRRLQGRGEALKLLAEMVRRRQDQGFNAAQSAAGVNASALGSLGSAGYMGAAQQAQNRMQNRENMMNLTANSIGGWLSNPNNGLSTIFQGSNNLRANPASTISAANAGANTAGRWSLR